MANFWETLPRPFTVLAPMEDVTDYAFRQVVTTLPRPDVMFTEFTSADALFSQGREANIHKLKYGVNERPIVAQIWGVHPKNMLKAAELARELGFDGVDINMGCPDKAVMKKGAGAAMCLNPDLAKEIIQAVQEGAKGIAVSVKTRLGYDVVKTTEWIGTILPLQLDALTVHGRTALQRSKGEADWFEIQKVVELRNQLSPRTAIIGNGDIKSYKEVVEKHTLHNVDGVMIGRGIFSDPWIFEKNLNPKEHSREEYIAVLLKHLELFEEAWGDTKNFAIMKKFFKMYVNNFPLAAQLRQELMFCTSGAEVREYLSSHLPV